MDQFSDFKSFIQSTFSVPLYKSYTPYDRNCRGASKELYKLMLLYAKQNPHLFNWIASLDIVTGMAHTFLRGTLSTQPGVYFYIDPTIAQFIPNFKEGIFVGSEQSLRQLAMLNGRNDILNDYIAIPGNYPPQIDTQLMNQVKSQIGGIKRRKKTTHRKTFTRNMKNRKRTRRY